MSMRSTSNFNLLMMIGYWKRGWIEELEILIWTQRKKRQRVLSFRPTIGCVQARAFHRPRNRSVQHFKLHSTSPAFACLELVLWKEYCFYGCWVQLLFFDVSIKWFFLIFFLYFYVSKFDIFRNKFFLIELRVS